MSKNINKLLSIGLLLIFLYVLFFGNNFKKHFKEGLSNQEDSSCNTCVAPSNWSSGECAEISQDEHGFYRMCSKMNKVFSHNKWIKCTDISHCETICNKEKHKDSTNSCKIYDVSFADYHGLAVHINPPYNKIKVNCGKCGKTKVYLGPDMSFNHHGFLPNPFLTDSKQHTAHTDPYIVVDHQNKHLCNNPENALKYKHTYACKGYLGYYTPNHGASGNPPTISPSTGNVQACEQESHGKNQTNQFNQINKYNYDKTERIRDDEFAEEIGDYITHLLEKLFMITNHEKTHSAIRNAGNILRAHPGKHASNLVTSIGTADPSKQNKISAGDHDLGYAQPSYHGLNSVNLPDMQGCDPSKGPEAYNCYFSM